MLGIAPKRGVECCLGEPSGFGHMTRKPKMTILIVGGFPPPGAKIFGGMVTSCKALLESSFSQRFEVELIDSTQISNPPPGLVTRAAIALKRLVAYSAKVVFGRPDAVVLFAAIGASILEKGAMAWMARLLGIPVFFFPRGAGLIDIAAGSRFHHAWIKASLRGGTYFLCQGPTWQRFATREIGFRLERAPIVPNWTASNRLLEIGARRVAQVPGHSPQLLFLGWLERSKGVFELLQACAELANSHSFRLIIAGRGNAEKAAREWVEQSALGRCVHFVGWVQGDDLDDLLAKSDVLVLPSWAEGLPNAMIEAMAAKLAVVVTAVGNIPDVVSDGVEALLVPPKDDVRLARALRGLLDDPLLCQSLAARGHAFARLHYAVEPAVERLSKIIERACERPSPPSLERKRA